MVFSSKDCVIRLSSKQQAHSTLAKQIHSKHFPKGIMICRACSGHNGSSSFTLLTERSQSPFPILLLPDPAQVFANKQTNKGVHYDISENKLCHQLNCYSLTCFSLSWTKSYSSQTFPPILMLEIGHRLREEYSTKAILCRIAFARLSTGPFPQILHPSWVIPCPHW